MKKINGKTSVIAVILAAALMLSLMLVGCDDGGEPVETGSAAQTTEVKVTVVDVDAAAQAILGKIKFDDTLAKIDSEAVKYRYGFENDITAAVYAGSGATAEEVAVFDAGSDAAAEELEKTAAKYIEDQIVSYQSYVPAEVSRLEKAIIKREGKYVIICVTADTAAAESAIDEALGR